MTISTNDAPDANTKTDAIPQQENSAIHGALADALTLLRVILTPIIMLLILKSWAGTPATEGVTLINLPLTILAALLFALAAITDLLDDIFARKARTGERIYGWFDDIADTILYGGCLLALVWAFTTTSQLHWSFAIPALTLIGRDVLVRIVQGHKSDSYGTIKTNLTDVKNGMAMVAVGLLLASPWLTNILHNVTNNASIGGISPIWNLGIFLLWIVAALAVITGVQIILEKNICSEITDET